MGRRSLLLRFLSLVPALFAGGCVFCPVCAPRSAAPPPCAVAAPAPLDTIVLLPDEGGKAGTVVVRASGGVRTLSRPMEAVRIGGDGSPGAPFLMDAASLRELAGPALDMLPEPPATFRLHFARGTTDLSPESEAVLREAVAAIRARRAVDVSVVGHTDTMGDKALNDRLSLERARAVASRLEKEGVSPAILEVASHGKDNPLVPTGDQVDEPKNRRVEVTVR